MSKNCDLTTFPYDDLRYCYGKPVLGGIRPEVYAIPARNIVEWPTLPDSLTATEMSDLALLKGHFDTAPNLWTKLTLVPDKNGITWETQGEHPARTFLNKATFVFPGTCEEATAFARQAVHDFLVFLVQQTDGRWRLLGSPSFPTDVKVSGGTGEGITGERGIKIEVEYTDVCPPPFYEGRFFTQSGDCIIAFFHSTGNQRCRNLIPHADSDYLEALTAKEVTNFTLEGDAIQLQGVNPNNEVTTTDPRFFIELRPYEQQRESCMFRLRLQIFGSSAFANRGVTLKVYDEKNAVLHTIPLEDLGAGGDLSATEHTCIMTGLIPSVDKPTKVRLGFSFTQGYHTRIVSSFALNYIPRHQ